MLKYQIALTTLPEINDFAERISGVDDDITLENETGKYRLRATSIIGIIAAVQDWNEVWVVGNSSELYGVISKYII